MKISKKLLSLLLCAVMVLGSVAIGGEGFAKVLDAFIVKASAVSETDFQNKISQLQNTFKDGEYWNYYSASDYSHSGKTPCPCGTAYCNNDACKCGYFAGGYQCFGYANKLANEIFGKYKGNGYSVRYDVGTIYAGDIIRFGSSDTIGHSIFVYKVSGNTIYFTDCNYSGPCKIRWGVTLSGLNNNTYYAGFKFLYVAHLDGNTVTGNGHTHSYDYSASIIKTPTSSSTGTRRCYCSCGAYTDQTIPALKYTTSFDNGTICRLVSRIDGRVLATNPGSNFDAFTTTNNNDYSDQEWVLLKNSDGTYTIQNRSNSSRALDIYGASMVNGGNVQTYEKNGTDAQKFYIVPANGYYKLVAKNSYMCVDAGTENHSVHQWEELSSSSSVINNQLWEIKCSTFTVSYKANGGSGAPGSQTKTNGVALTLSSTKPTRSVTITLNPQSGTVSPTSKTVSYTFKNWNTKSDGSGTAYSSGATYSANAALTLYAQWTNPAAYTLPTPTRTGYNFKGWNTKSDGTGTTYAAGASYKATSNVTLYAIWNLNTYSVVYNANGGTGAPGSQTKTHGTNLTLSSTKPTRSVTITLNPQSGIVSPTSKTVSYTFKNWNTKADGSGTVYSSGATYSANAAVTLYAQWTNPAAYILPTPTRNVTITLDPQSGNVSPTSKAVSLAFKNWNTKADGSGTAYSAGAAYSATANATLYAQWTNSAAYTLPTPTRTGYDFKGWNTKADGTGTSYSAGASYSATANVTLYAIWSIKTYTVTYNANGGTGVPANQTKTYGVTLTLSMVVPTKYGYDFNGWNTKQDGSGDKYTAYASYTKNESVTLYAQWRIKTYGLIYDLNYDTDMPIYSAPVKTHDVDIAIIDDIPQRPSHVFIGWNTEEDGSGKTYLPGDIYSANENGTLYAQWREYETGDIIYYGSYPQSKVTDSSLISALNNESGSWVSYGYYSGTALQKSGTMKSSDFMRYKDVIYRGNKYRAVIFDNYRPDNTLSEPANTTQKKNGYYSNNVYWFKYEPIAWRILDPSTGLIMCDIAIDSQAFNNCVYSDGSDSYGDSACTYYASNYANSSIRAWLNQDFYNTTFSDEQKSNIVATTLDNNSNVSSIYDAPSTTDNVFLLSKTDVTNNKYGFALSERYNSATRQLMSTDYAKCQGCYSYHSDNNYPDTCDWMLRSSMSAGSIVLVAYDGSCDINSSVCQTHFGIVPALRLSTLVSDLKDTDDALTNAKNKAINELEQIKGSFVSDEAKTIIENGKKDVNSAKTIEEVGSVVSRIKTGAEKAENDYVNNNSDKIVIKIAGEKTINFRSDVTITATSNNVPYGCRLVLYVGDRKVAEGDNKSVSYEYGQIRNDLNYTVKVVDANGNIIKDSNGNEVKKDGGKITCDAGFFKKLIAFFRSLFQLLPKVEVKPQ